MRQVALRGIPDDVHRELKAAAARLNGEILARLTASVRPDTGDVTVLLERIRRRHEALGSLDLSEATLRDLRNAGRP